MDDEKDLKTLLKETGVKIIFVLVSVVIATLFSNVITFYYDKFVDGGHFGVILVLEILFFSWLEYKKIYKSNSFLRSCFKNVDEKKIKLKKEEGKLQNIKNVDYYREIICDGNIMRLYWFLYQYDLMIEQTDIIGAMILKWIKDDRVTLLKNNDIAFDKSYDDIDDVNEKALIDILIQASGNNKILEVSELKRWAKEHKSFLTKWFYSIIEKQNDIFEKEGLIYEKNGYKYISAKLDEEAEKILGFKKFLLDYSLIYERYPIEVALWEEYLILAQVIGIADKVRKDLKKLYPNSKEIQENDRICSKMLSNTFRFLVCFSSLGIGFFIAFAINLYIAFLKGIIFIENIIIGR